MTIAQNLLSNLFYEPPRCETITPPRRTHAQQTASKDCARRDYITLLLLYCFRARDKSCKKKKTPWHRARKHFVHTQEDKGRAASGWWRVRVQQANTHTHRDTNQKRAKINCVEVLLLF